MNSNKQHEGLQLQGIEEVSHLTARVADLERKVSVLRKESDVSVTKLWLQIIADDV